MRQFESLHQRLVEVGPHGLSQQVLFLLLRWLSVIYGLIVRLRSLAFNVGLRTVYHTRIPVVAIGNLAVGGTGKTPMVDLLLRYAQQKDLRAAVVSRGYGGSFQGEVGIVSLGEGPLLSADEAGDEPCLLARRNPQAVVLVAAKRRLAIEYIERHNCADLIILDDAFQHRQVARDLNLLLVDTRKPFGNGLLLPAGILREPPSAVSRADLICLTGEPAAENSYTWDKPAVRVRNFLANELISLQGEKCSFTDIAGKKVVAFAGIARPERFFLALEKKGVVLQERLALGDHVVYDQQTIQKIIAEAANADLLLTTEKDAVKLSARSLPCPCFSAGLEICIEEESTFFSHLDRVIGRNHHMPLAKELLEILACPKCKGEVSLQQVDSAEELVCSTCHLAYPIRDGIPVMLIDEAETVES